VISLETIGEKERKINGENIGRKRGREKGGKKCRLQKAEGRLGMNHRGAGESKK